MRIRLIGQRNRTGIGTHYAYFADALRRCTTTEIQEIDYQNDDQVRRAIDDSDEQDVNISFVGANIHKFFAGRIIQWIVFESTRIAPHLHECLHQSNQIWVPSEWGRNILLQNGYGSKYIRVVPEGVDGAFTSGFPQEKNEIFTYLLVGKYEQRKGIKETVEAFKLAWGNDQDKQLWLKTNRCQELVDLIGDSKNIHVFDGDLDMVQLYMKCHVFVLPTRGEGWGLPIIEAAASGLPIITTYYSAQTEYLNQIQNSCYFVDFNLVDINCPLYKVCYPTPDGNYGKWAQPSVDSIAQAMLDVHKSYQFADYKAKDSEFIIKSQYTWVKSAEKALKILENQRLSDII